jgi:hypothetical protein
MSGLDADQVAITEKLATQVESSRMDRWVEVNRPRLELYFS